MSSTSGLPVTATGASTNSLLEKLGLLLVALVVLRFTRTIIGFTYRHLLGPSVLCRGAVDFAKCGKWAGKFSEQPVHSNRQFVHGLGNGFLFLLWHLGDL